MTAQQIILAAAEKSVIPRALATGQLGSRSVDITRLLHCTLRLASFDAEHAPRLVQQLEAANIQRQADTILDDLRDEL